jgi:hypothetical protein
MKRTKLLLILSLLVIAFVIACKKNKPVKTDNLVVTTSDSCNCEANWFPHATTPPPMEGAGSPFDTNSTTNCIFHQWSWQKFLWLTRPLSNGHAFFQDSLLQVDAEMNAVTPQNGIVLVLEDTAQAGSGGSLNTNPAYGGDQTKHLVYYSIFVDPIFMAAAEGFKAAMGTDTNNLNNLDMFPVGSLELKISWVSIDAIPAAQRADYYTTQAAVKVGSTYQTTTVALLGMHVVGRVINHPEFIWATFEHQGMAPFYNWAATTSTQDAPITSSTQTLLFAQGSTTTLGGITWSSSTGNIIPYQVYTLYKYGVPRVPLDTFMTGTSQSEPLNYNNIDNLNNCVASNLGNDVWNNYFYNGSIWVNMDGLTPTQQAQLLVTQQDNLGNAQTGSVARGSLSVFNLTMETYVQTLAEDSTNNIHTIEVGDIFNCLTCHNASPYSLSFNGVAYKGKTSPLYVSHIFRNYVSNTSGKFTLKAAKQQGIIDFIEDIKLKRKQMKK